MVIWEYKVVELSLLLNDEESKQKLHALGRTREKELNALGQEGWELVSVAYGNYEMRAQAYLKRRKE